MAHRNTSPTFPISKEQLVRKKSEAIAKSKLTRVAIAGGIAALVLLPSFYGILAFGGIALGTALFWKKHLPRIEEQILQSLIETSNKEQNRSLKKGIERLHDWDYHDYAEQLSEVANLKKQVEETIHSQEPRTSMDESIESLVDTLCNEVSRDLFRMADIDYTLRKKRKRLTNEQKKEMKTDRDELGARVREAVVALKDSHAQLTLTTGKKVPNQGQNPVLDETIARLREEAALAQRIRARIESNFSDTLETAASQTTYSSSGDITQ